jgi:hypothetical protein
LKHFLLFVILFAGLFLTTTTAQVGPINDSIIGGSPYINPSDTTPKPEKKETTTSPVISNQTTKNDSISFVKHSPKKATLLSTFVPGAGQFYNKKYWKMPFIYVAGGAAIYGAVHYGGKYQDFKDAYKTRLETGANDNDTYYNQFQTATLQSYRDYYRYYRDLTYIGIAAVYVLQIVDAAVDAHFYDFKITEDLTLNIQPTFQYVGPVANPQLMFTLKF